MLMFFQGLQNERHRAAVWLVQYAGKHGKLFNLVQTNNLPMISISNNLCY